MGETKVLMSALAAAVAEGPAPLVSLFQDQGSKAKKFDVVKAVGGLTKASDRQELSDRLEYMTSEVLAKEPVDEQAEDEDTREKEAIKRRQVVGAAAMIMKVFLQHEDWIAPTALFTVICRLHAEIFASSDAPSLQNELSELCELWFLQGRSGREAVAPQMVTYLLAKSLATDCKIVDVKRLFSVREALELLDWDDEDSLQLRVLMQRTFLHHTFLTNAEGNKFLVWALSTLPLIAILHKTVKTALVSAPKWKQTVYSQIYFKAWQKSTGIQKLRLENHAIQNLIEASLHCQNATVLKTVKSILKYFVDQKASDKNVEELLYRLYSPVIFRALQVANPSVRENALYQLAMVFPLVPPTLPQGEFDEALQDQVHILVDALEDPMPKVRAQAVLSIGRILALFWEILPPQSLHAIISHLVNEVAFDKTSPNVREATFKAMGALLENPLTHRFLKDKAYLARLSPLIFDTTDRVRLACATLLEQVKKIKLIRFYEVVELDRILDALAHENAPKVRTALCRVLQSSYWPADRYPIAEIVTRAKDMIATNAEAAVAFYASAPLLQADPSTAARFMAQLWSEVVRPAAAQYLQEASEGSKAKSRPKPNLKTKTDEDEAEPRSKRSKTKEQDENVPFESKPENIANTIKVVAGVWDQIDDKLDDLELIRDLLAVFDDRELAVLHQHFPLTAIALIAARLPPNEGLRLFANGILDTACDPTLAKASGNLSDAQATSLTCILAWESDHLAQLIDVIHEHLTTGSNAHRLHALRVIQCCLDSKHEWMRQTLLNLPSFAERIPPALKEYQFAAESHMSGQEIDISEAVTVEGISLRMKILLHQSVVGASVEEEYLELSHWAQWLVPYLQAKSREDELDLETDEKCPPEISFALRIVGTILVVLNDYELLASVNATTRVDLGLWKLVGLLLKVRSDAKFLRLCTAVGWKLVSRRLIGASNDIDVTVNGENDGEIGLTPMVLLLILRDQSTGHKHSVSSLRAVATQRKEAIQGCLEHVWSVCAAQLPTDNFEHELDLVDGIPVEVDTIMTAFAGTTQMVNLLASWLRAKIQAENRSPASVWTGIQLLALCLRPVKRFSAPSLTPIKLLITALFGSMKEADETESVLRSRLAQLLKSPHFSTKIATKPIVQPEDAS